MSSEIVLSTRCYAKIVMHLLKYPHATVNGVILSENKRKSGKDGNVIEFVDAIPMFHVGHGLTPMLEVALLQVINYLNIFLFPKRLGIEKMQIHSF